MSTEKINTDIPHNERAMPNLPGYPGGAAQRDPIRTLDHGNTSEPGIDLSWVEHDINFRIKKLSSYGARRAIETLCEAKNISLPRMIVMRSPRFMRNWSDESVEAFFGKRPEVNDKEALLKKYVGFVPRDYRNDKNSGRLYREKVNLGLTVNIETTSKRFDGVALLMIAVDGEGVANVMLLDRVNVDGIKNVRVLCSAEVEGEEYSDLVSAVLDCFEEGFWGGYVNDIEGLFYGENSANEIMSL